MKGFICQNKSVRFSGTSCFILDFHHIYFSVTWIDIFICFRLVWRSLGHSGCFYAAAATSDVWENLPVNQLNVCSSSRIKSPAHSRLSEASPTFIKFDIFWGHTFSGPQMFLCFCLFLFLSLWVQMMVQIYWKRQTQPQIIFFVLPGDDKPETEAHWRQQPCVSENSDTCWWNACICSHCCRPSDFVQ